MKAWSTTKPELGRSSAEDLRRPAKGAVKKIAPTFLWLLVQFFFTAPLQAEAPPMRWSDVRVRSCVAGNQKHIVIDRSISNDIRPCSAPSLVPKAHSFTRYDATKINRLLR